MFRLIKSMIYLSLFGAAIFFGGPVLINYFLKTQIQQIATKTFGTEASVDNVRVSLLKLSGTIQGLSVANPNGYAAAEAFGLEALSFDIDPKSLLSPPVRVNTFLVKQMRAAYEVNDQGVGNFNVLFDGLSQQAPEETAEPATGEGSIRIVIDQIQVIDTALSLDLSAMGKKRYEEKLPQFYAKHVGGDQGVRPNELGKEIARIMLGNLVAETKESYKNKIKSGIKDKVLDNIQNKIGKGIEGFMERF